MEDYLDIVYDEKSRPFSSYPEKLISHIIDICELEKENNQTLIEPGVGRGEHLRIFKNNGFNVKGLDISIKSVEMSPDLDIDLINSDGLTWPYPDASFDVVYSKSFIEHLQNPESYLNEAFRVLKPGGKIINLTPDWDTCYVKFFDDFTHKTPFTSVSLDQITRMIGFVDVKSYAFRQLPLTWKYPFFNFISSIIAPFVPVRTTNKFFRWSRELMLIGYGVKPLN
jgi:ubiquinone/menaquinone biosynthesis C-methylase UbiE